MSKDMIVVSPDSPNYEQPSKLHIFLYRPITPYSFPIELLAQYLKDLLHDKLKGGKIEIRPEFLQNYVIAHDNINAKKNAAELTASCRLEDVKKQGFPAEQNKNLFVFYSAMELNLQEGIPPERSKEFLYHGPRMMSVYRRYIPENERTIDHLHIILTDRIICTWDNSDARYHARSIIMGFPNIISMPGIVEAPARPREYYIKRHLYASAGLTLDELEAEFAGQYLIYKDERTLDVIKGYALQAVFYTLFKEPFCEKKTCRLYNAHWQSELLDSQLKSGKLCPNHQQMLDRWIKSLEDDK
jgi:hypothetical protein